VFNIGCKIQVMDMPMKNPPYPGAGLKHDIASLGLSVAEAAAGLGVTRQQLYRIIRSQSGISPEMAVRLEKAIGGTADGWLRIQLNHDLPQIRARAGSLKIKRLEPKVA
jgi:addiction module HigA family antidote